MTRIYTRQGDAGQTDLGDGRRVGKDAPRVAACGALDELGAVLGLAASSGLDPSLAAALDRVRQQLFDVAGELALAPPGAGVDGAWVAQLEEELDRWAAQLPPLDRFILPGGAPVAACLHMARTVCRRAEREVVGLGREEPVRPVVVTYLNRLSDWLFQLARLSNRRAGVSDLPWERRG